MTAELTGAEGLKAGVDCPGWCIECLIDNPTADNSAIFPATLTLTEAAAVLGQPVSTSVNCPCFGCNDIYADVTCSPEGLQGIELVNTSTQV